MQRPPDPCIQKLNAEQYLDTRTGEVKNFKRTQTRSESLATVSKSLRNLRDLINTNLTDPNTALWVTLTYKENMTDHVRLYNDYRRFWQRLKYYAGKHGLPPPEYIVAAEPQGRGAWHLHCLFLFPGKAPFIPNPKMAELWGHGFTKTRGLSSVDNPGLYLTAYLGDMEFQDAVGNGLADGRVKRDTRKHKAFIKGARLHLYPANFKLYRHSRGVKYPTVFRTTEIEAQKIIGSAPLVYERTLATQDIAGNTLNITNFRQYNRAC